MRTLDIQQAQATADSKLSLAAYSAYLKDLYGLRKDNCGCSPVKPLLLLRYALAKWDFRAGAYNFYSEETLAKIIRNINKL